MERKKEPIEYLEVGVHPSEFLLRLRALSDVDDDRDAARYRAIIAAYPIAGDENLDHLAVLSNVCIGLAVDAPGLEESRQHDAHRVVL